MRRRIDLFCEDAAHEGVGRALIERSAKQENLDINLRIASARCGIPRLRAELRAFEAVVRRSAGVPDILVIIVDANAVGPSARRTEVDALIDTAIFPAHVIGTPDPCIERWMVADPPSFVTTFGHAPETGLARDGNKWKVRLVEALEAAGEVVTQGGSEFAEEIVSAMDLQRAGRAVPSLGAFVADLAGAMRILRMNCDPKTSLAIG